MHNQKKGVYVLKPANPYVQQMFNARKHIASLKQTLLKKTQQNKQPKKEDKNLLR